MKINSLFCLLTFFAMGLMFYLDYNRYIMRSINRNLLQFNLIMFLIKSFTDKSSFGKLPIFLNSVERYKKNSTFGSTILQ
jgi:hypothetical protein